MKNYAYVMDAPCKKCGLKHYYMTKDHVVIIGTKEELEHVDFSLADRIELYNKNKSDIKKADHIFKIYDGLAGCMKFAKIK